LTTPGQHHIGATYNGDSQFEDSSDPDGELHEVTNVAPTANDDGYTTPGGGAPLTVDAANGVLNNDTDPNGTVLTASPPSPPTTNNGTVALQSDGSFTYTPFAGFSGTDTFTYTASDGQLTSSATVTINVNP
jgi:Bacterial Ig domain